MMAYTVFGNDQQWQPQVERPYKDGAPGLLLVTHKLLAVQHSRRSPCNDIMILPVNSSERYHNVTTIITWNSPEL